MIGPRKRDLGFFKRWARYLYLAFVALLAVNAEAFVRGIPNYPALNYILVGLVVLAALGQRLLLHSKWYDSYRKVVSRSIAWFFAAVGLTLLALVQSMIPLFSGKSSPLINLLLAVTIGVEFIAGGSLLYASDQVKLSEDELTAKPKEKESTPNSDPIPHETESESFPTPRNNVVELIDRVDGKFSEWRRSTLYIWLGAVSLLFVLINVALLSYQDIGVRFAITASGVAVILSMAQIVLDQFESWIAFANYRELRRGEEDPLLYAIILMKTSQPKIQLRDIYRVNPDLFKRQALVERLYT